MSNRLEGKVAIVTGAGRGIGHASAVRFASEGAVVVCADLDGEAAAACAEEIGANGGRASAIPVDVADPEATSAMAGMTIERHGQIDVLFANAGTTLQRDAIACTPEEWNRVVAVNLTGSWLCSRAVLPSMISAGAGSIVLMSSAAGMTGLRGGCPYAAAKAGVIGLTRQLAVEYGPDGIRVNAVVPGSFVTPLVLEAYEARVAQGKYPSVEEGLRQSGANYPLRRVGHVDECANLALFLASDESSFITGGVYPVDGGLTATRELIPPSAPTASG